MIDATHLVERLLRQVAAEHGLRDVRELRGPLRVKHIARARHHAMALLRWSTGLSTPEIGLIFNRDHTSVISGVARWEREINRGSDP